MSLILSVVIKYEHDVVAARQRARQIAGLLGFDTRDQTRIATAVSEIARNAFTYAGGGHVEFRVEGGPAPPPLPPQRAPHPPRGRGGLFSPPGPRTAPPPASPGTPPTPSPAPAGAPVGCGGGGRPPPLPSRVRVPAPARGTAPLGGEGRRRGAPLHSELDVAAA